MLAVSSLTTYRNKVLFLLVIPLLLPLLAAQVAAAPARDVLYQISTIDSLMAGLFDGYASIGEVMKHGDFGLGTFDKLDGEMVAVDGKVYQVTSDGTARKADATVTTPFAAVTFFDRDTAATISEEMTLPKLQEYLDGMLLSKNLFYAIRIDGEFTRVKTRSVPAQNKPYPRLVDVTAKQPVFEMTDVKGTIVALRCPYFVKGVNVPGYHMHFLTSDHKRGGHLLDCSVKSGVVSVDITSGFLLSLPTDEVFYHTDFEPQSQGELEKVEK